MTDAVDSFSAAFPQPPSSRRSAREARAKKERRTQRTDKQRNRIATRTEQMCFRCSPEFRARVNALKALAAGSIADVLEDAIAALERASETSERQ